MGIGDTENVVKTLLGLSPSQWAVTIFLSIGSVGIAFWIENRYAKIEETNISIKKTEMEIKKHKDEILQMHIKTLELIRLHPRHVQEEMDRNAKTTFEQYLRMQQELAK